MAENNLISVVDDDPSMCRMLTRVLTAIGFEVGVFSSAEDFLASGRINDSDCLILDVDLTGISGIQLQQQLNESGSTVPIIFISGHADTDVREQVLAAGAIGFFNKPFRIDALLAAINALTSLSLS